MRELLCYPLGHGGNFNESSPHTPDAVDLYFHWLDTQSPPMSAEKLKRLHSNIQNNTNYCSVSSGL